jgi:hypothetical protein
MNFRPHPLEIGNMEVMEVMGLPHLTKKAVFRKSNAGKVSLSCISSITFIMFITLIMYYFLFPRDRG